MIKWFNVKAKNGVASLYSNSITLNTTAMFPFDIAYKVQVGLSEEGNIIVKPLTKAFIETGKLDENCLLKIDMHKSYARIASVSLMKQIGEALNITLSKTPIQYETTWDSVENILTIHTSQALKNK